MGLLLRETQRGYTFDFMYVTKQNNRLCDYFCRNIIMIYLILYNNILFIPLSLLSLLYRNK